MEKPPSLKKGDKIAIISTARKIFKIELEPAVAIIKSWGLEPVFGKNLFNENHQFSGTTKERVADLQNALDNSEIKAIICARGGYGTVQVIDQIDFSNFKKNPKWIVGYSDVTVLHNHINTNFNIQTLHASMPINFATNTKEALESLKETLFGALPIYTCDVDELNKLGDATGELVGGNLSIIYSLTGTRSQINTKGKILFLEDLDEYLYHIDRMMMNLKLAGLLTELKGLIVGGMSDMNDNTVPYGKTAKQIIFDVVKEYNYPVCFEFPAGHIKDNRALMMGAEVDLKVSKNEVELSFK
ncbi:MAG: LD-carboxypeptidase [Flavobacteriales bacterium]|nr:LD-carboxypeptidase [Flavobacteriales bacterium]MCB9175011.1 LD-carboxypeptidase [Flavobacteriales bacterium]